MNDNIEVKIGSEWMTAKSASPFASDTEFKVTDIARGLIRYQYDNGTTGQKPVATFREFVRNGTLTTKAVKPVKPLRLQPGQCWVTVRSLCPLKLGVRFEILRIEGQKVYYKYLDKTSENYRFISDLEAYFEEGWIIPAPTDAQTPTECWESKGPFANPFKAPAGPFEVGLAEFRRTIDPAAGLSPQLQWDQQGNFAGLCLRQTRTGQSHVIKPSAPELKHTPSSEADKMATIAGLTRMLGETDAMLKDRIMAVLAEGAPRQKNAQEGIVGRTGAMLVDDVPTIFFKHKSHELYAQTIMEKTMTRIVDVFLMDTTTGLKAAERMIGKVENFASDARDNTTMLLELSMEHNLKEMLDAHNKRRKAIINQDILNRVGKTVYLQPIELKDVKIDIKVVTEV